MLLRFEGRVALCSPRTGLQSFNGSVPLGSGLHMCFSSSPTPPWVGKDGWSGMKVGSFLSAVWNARSDLSWMFSFS